VQILTSRLIALVWAGAALLGAQDPGTTSEELPTIRAVEGDLHVWSSSKDKVAPVTESQRVTPLDRIGTRKDKHAMLATQDGSLISLSDVEVGREKGLALERTKDKLVIKLYKGKLAVQTFQTGLRVETPNGTVEGGKACCVVQVDGKKTRVFAVDEPLNFVNSLGTVKLEPGQESSAEKTAKPSDPKPADVDKAASEFTAAMASLNLVKNPGFEEGLKDWAVEQVDGKDAVTLESGLSHSGRQCARVEVSNRLFGSKPANWLGLKQGVGLTPGKKYLFRAYVRQETRAGTVRPYFTIGTRRGPRWTAEAVEKTWLRCTGVFTPDTDFPFRVAIEADTQSERYDAIFWVDDLIVMELK
jgi:hypothetical protein